MKCRQGCRGSLYRAWEKCTEASESCGVSRGSCGVSRRSCGGIRGAAALGLAAALGVLPVRAECGSTDDSWVLGAAASWRGLLLGVAVQGVGRR